MELWSLVGLPPPRRKRICHNRIPPNRRGTFRIRTIPALPHTYLSTAIPLKITSKTGPKTLHSPSLSEVVDLTSSRSCCCSWAAATRLAASSTEVSAPARITEREGGSLVFKEPLRAALSLLGRTIQYNNVLGGGQKGSKKEGRAAAAVHVHEIPVCEKKGGSTSRMCTCTVLVCMVCICVRQKVSVEDEQTKE